MNGVVYNIQRMSTEDGPGLRTTVFLKGCPLRCSWCSNPESQSFKPQLMIFSDLCSGCGACEQTCTHEAIVKTGDKYNRDRAICTDCGDCVDVCPTKAREMSGKYMTVEEVINIVDKDSLFYGNSGGGVTFGGGEPTAAGDFLLALLDASAKRGYHTCLDTCGACPPERFKKVIPRTDLFLFDCKHMDPEEHRRLTGHDNTVILQNLSSLFEAKKELQIRMPLLPNINDTEQNIAALSSFLHKHGQYEVDVLPYHTFGYSKYDALNLPHPIIEPYTPEELEAALDRFKKHDLKITIA